jgi:orotate phosphoribosyltransferase
VRSHKIAGLLPTRRGHFRLESGHHFDRFIDLEMLFVLPKALQPFAKTLATRLRPHNIEAICGPMVEGAFIAMMVAEKLGVPFTYAERIADDTLTGLFTVRYRLPGAQRQLVHGKRVAIVNDVISAGSAVRGTYNDLVECGATPVIVAALAVLGSRAEKWAAEKQLPLETLVTLPNEVWEPDTCPLCQQGMPLNN